MQHLNPEILGRYRTGNMDGDELLNVDDHLAQCEDLPRYPFCSKHQHTSSWPAIARRLSRTSSDEQQHLTYEQLKRYVDVAMLPFEAQRDRIAYLHPAQIAAPKPPISSFRPQSLRKKSKLFPFNRF